MSAVRIGRPGQPVRLVAEHVPVLTKRQAQILHLVRSFGGNRSRTARHLGVTVGAVQRSIGYALRAGASVPPPATRLGIPDRQRRVIGARCSEPMRNGRCGRPLDHPGWHIGERAWFRRRTCAPLITR